MQGNGDGARRATRTAGINYVTALSPSEEVPGAERGAAGGLLPFNSPPHLAMPACVLALLPRDVAFHVWSFGQLLLLVPLIHFLRRLATDHRPLPWAVVLTAVLAFPPLFLSFQLGQVSLLALVCLLGFVCNLTAGRPLATALWLTLGTLKPQLMVVPAVILLAGRRWRELVLAAGLFAGWALLTSVFLGASCWSAFANVLRHSAWQFGGDGIHPLAMYNLKGLLTSLLDTPRAPAINVLTASAWLLVLLATLWTWRGEWRRGEPEFDLRLAWTLQLGLLVNPHFNPADAVTLIAPALLFYRGLRRSSRAARAVGVVLVCGPLLFALDCYGPMAIRPMAIHPFFLVMVVLAAAMAAMAAIARLSAKSIEEAPLP